MDEFVQSLKSIGLTQLCKAALLAATHMTKGVLDDPAPKVVLTKYGDCWIDYTLFAWAKSEELKMVEFRLNEVIHDVFAKYHLEFPYPKMTLLRPEQMPAVTAPPTGADGAAEALAASDLLKESTPAEIPSLAAADAASSVAKARSSAAGARSSAVNAASPVPMGTASSVAGARSSTPETSADLLKKDPFRPWKNLTKKSSSGKRK